MPTANSSRGPQDNRQVVMRRGLWVAAGVVVAGAAYLGAAAALADRIPSGTRIGSVDVGGMNQQKAIDAIDAAVKKYETTPVTVSAEKHQARLIPNKVGLSLDGRAALDGLTGFTLNPGTLLDRLFGSHDDHRFTVKVDRNALQTAIAAAGADLPGAAKNATVGYRGTTPTVLSAGVDGLAFDVDSVASQIRSQWPGRTAFTDKLVHRPPTITTKDAQDWVDGPGRTAVSGPVVAKAGTRSASITPAQIAPVVRTEVKDGHLLTTADPKQFTALMDTVGTSLVTTPTNGRILISGDKAAKKTYTAGTDGQELKLDGAAQAFTTAVTSDTRRSFVVPVTTRKSDWTQDRLKKIRLDKVSSFDTSLPGGSSNAARTKNITIGLQKINGIVVDKGEQFSLAEALGRLDAKDGYVDAPTIQNGVETPGLGGGLSQVSTTLYNAAFFAGAQLDEHVPHTFWIPRYPMGREATLWSGTIDNKWTNTTDGPIVIQAGVVHDEKTGDQVRVTFLGTPTFTVQSTTSDQIGYEAPKTVVVHDPRCIAQVPQPGFTVNVTRVVKRGDKVVSDQVFTTHYQAADRIECE